MAQIKRYEAVDMAEAIKQIKREMGPDAIILASRKVTKGVGAFGLFGRPVIEVTAAPPSYYQEQEKRKRVPAPPPPPPRDERWDEPRPRDDRDRRGDQRHRDDRRSQGGRRDDHHSYDDGRDDYYSTRVGRDEGYRAPDRRINELPPDNGSMDPKLLIEGAVVAMEPVMDRMEKLRMELEQLRRREPDNDPSAERIAGDVREMKSMISYLLDQAAAEKEKSLGKGYLALSRVLQERGLATEYIQTLVGEIKRNVGEGPEPDLRTLIHVAAGRLRDAITFGGWITRPKKGDTSPRTVALVGSTGVGKTTTVAKIAAGLTMSGAKVTLITIDTFRIAAVEQLKIYAKILNIPLEVALTTSDFARALQMNERADVILIDTAGRSQRDAEQISELKKFFDCGRDMEAQIVVSASASEKQMEEAIHNFSVLPVSGMIFTKLDEAVSLGSVINQSVRTGLPVSYLTTGQRVPEDIEEATAKRLVNGLFKS